MSDGAMSNDEERSKSGGGGKAPRKQLAVGGRRKQQAAERQKAAKAETPAAAEPHDIALTVIYGKGIHGKEATPAVAAFQTKVREALHIVHAAGANDRCVISVVEFPFGRAEGIRAEGMRGSPVYPGTVPAIRQHCERKIAAAFGSNSGDVRCRILNHVVPSRKHMLHGFPAGVLGPEQNNFTLVVESVSLWLQDWAFERNAERKALVEEYLAPAVSAFGGDRAPRQLATMADLQAFLRVRFHDDCRTLAPTCVFMTKEDSEHVDRFTPKAAPSPGSMFASFGAQPRALPQVPHMSVRLIYGTGADGFPAGTIRRFHVGMQTADEIRKQCTPVLAQPHEEKKRDNDFAFKAVAMPAALLAAPETLMFSGNPKTIMHITIVSPADFRC